VTRPPRSQGETPERALEALVHHHHGGRRRRHPLHFDPLAANSFTYGDPTEPGSVAIEDLVNVDVTGFATRAGEPLPWRSVVSDYTAPAGQITCDANGTSFTVANSLAAYLGYSASSGGHMNADGECEVQSNFTP
jgi:hypothetical protein